MDYVKVITPGLTYTSLAGPNQDSDFWGAHITNGVLPVRGRTYMVIKELDHPSNPYNRLMVIMDVNYVAFIIGIDGIEESTEAEFYSESSIGEVVSSAKKPAVAKPRIYRPEVSSEKYEVGDVIVITDRKSVSYGKRFRVTDPNYKGYDVVTSYSETGTDRSQGFKFNQFERYIPEPEVLPDDKPKFSKNELLEVLNQLNKTPEEMILDLMDHITN